jgi:hypothetical protein
MVTATPTNPSAPVLSATSRARLKLDPQVDWFAPQPLWRVFPRDELASRRNTPVILRFEGDNFMDVLLATLANKPEAMADFVAQAETWRAPVVGLDAPNVDESDLLKLYQAAHNRFYLVTGALACRIPGVPDRTIDVSRDERAFFVMRRLRISATGSVAEQGWGTGKSGGTKGWSTISGNPRHMLVTDEERFPLFPLFCTVDGTQRRVMAGLIGVASNETQRGAFPQVNTSTDGGDPRPGLFEQQVTVALYGLRVPLSTIDDLPNHERRQIEHALVYALLDLMTALKDYRRGLYDDIRAGALRTPLSVYGTATALATLIDNTVIKGTTPTTIVKLVKLLQQLESKRAQLLADTFTADSEVSTHAPLISDLSQLGYNLNPWLAINGVWPTSGLYQFRAGETAVQEAFNALLPQPYTPPVDLTFPEIPKFDPARPGDVFIIRMVYERPNCKLPTISLPTRAFVPAPFFDPDAPVRPIRIPMPVDTTTEGLKKYGKGVSFILSNQLRAQMDRVKGLKELMDGDLNGEAQLDIGMICSFSIPIITICALIVLMIFVSLLNIIFWWMPFLKICLPIPVIRQD